MVDISSRPDLQIPGFTPAESEFVLGFVYNAVMPIAKSFGVESDEILSGMRQTEFPQLSKSVFGGLQHVVSVDNAANYVELWRQGGNWYAVTGAIQKSQVADWDSINLIPGVSKGMRISEVMPLFLKSSLDCKCNK